MCRSKRRAYFYDMSELTQEDARAAWDLLQEGNVKPNAIFDQDGLKVRTWNNLRSYKKGDIVKRNGVVIGTAVQDTDWREDDLWIYVKDHETTQPTDDSSG